MMVKFIIIWVDKESGEDGEYTCRVKARPFLHMFRSGRRHPKNRRLFRHFQECTRVPTACSRHLDEELHTDEFPESAVRTGLCSLVSVHRSSSDRKWKAWMSRLSTGSTKTATPFSS